MRALVVEHNESLRKLFRLFLKKNGFVTEDTSNGLIALQLLLRNNYDIIITDMDMPEVDGMELYECISTLLPHLIRRIIFATGNSVSEKYKKFYNSIPCPVLYKPFPLVELKKLIESMLEKNSEIQPQKSNAI